VDLNIYNTDIMRKIARETEIHLDHLVIIHIYIYG
jgi:hypothetical protein